MRKEDKELLYIDLCGRLPYGVKCQVQEDEYTYIGTLCRIEVDNKNGYLLDFVESMSSLDCQVNISKVKPFLFPLSSMKEEQMEELEELCDMYTPDDDYHPYAYKGIKVLYKHVLDDNYEFNFKTDVIDWFHKNHIDYRGLIPVGLANDATGKGIY